MRKGRHRRHGPRTKSGRLRLVTVSPATIAATMPHRRGLGDQVADARAATLLGRLVLTRLLERELGIAGENFLGQWQGYLFTIGGPQAFANGSNLTYTCDGCSPDVKYCRCWMRAQVYKESQRVLLSAGDAAYHAVWQTVVLDQVASIPALRAGLLALALHYGLLSQKNANSLNAASPKLSD